MISKWVSSLLRGKVLSVVAVSLAMVGGATAMAASTTAGSHLVHMFVGSATTPTSHHGTFSVSGGPTNCPGLPQAQELATHFSLSTRSTSDAIQAICSLHLGTFRGTTPDGTTVTSRRVFGYGEISDLLTYAQYLATHGGGKLTDANARSYLAQALQTCGSTAIETCLQARIPGFQPGQNGKGNGKPSSTPTSGQGHGKPASTPTPQGGKPASTPTPHR